LEEIVAAPVKKTETNDPGGSVAMTTQHPLTAKVGTTSPTSGGRSVGIVRSRTKATEVFLLLLFAFQNPVILEHIFTFIILLMGHAVA
jgi:hypothetical protein